MSTIFYILVKRPSTHSDILLPQDTGAGSMADKSNNKSKVPAGTGIAIGAALGVAFGVLYNQLALGLALGTAFGAVFDVVSHQRHKNKH